MKNLLLLIVSLIILGKASAAEPYVGQWKSGMRGDFENGQTAKSFSDLFLKEDKSFRWYMKFALPGGREHVVDEVGTYRIEEDRLLLHYQSSPDRAQTWRFKVEGDTLWLMDKEGIEKIPYRRIKEN